MVVAELLQWRVPVALITAILLLAFNPRLQQREELPNISLISSFSGPVVCNSGNVFVSIYIAMCIHVYMLRQDNDYVELFAGSGEVSASLRQAWQLWVHVDSVYLAGFSLGKDGAGGTTFELMDNPLIFDLTSNSGFALALNEIRRLRPGACAIVAVCCESYSAMCLMLH